MRYFVLLVWEAKGNQELVVRSLAGIPDRYRDIAIAYPIRLGGMVRDRVRVGLITPARAIRPTDRVRQN